MIDEDGWIGQSEVDFWCDCIQYDWDSFGSSCSHAFVLESCICSLCGIPMCDAYGVICPQKETCETLFWYKLLRE